MSKLLNLDAKRIRAEVIQHYMGAVGKWGDKVVCFTCGNAASWLRVNQLDVLEFGANGKANPNHWWHPMEIARYFPDRFDATSGHLSMDLMLQIGVALRSNIDRHNETSDNTGPNSLRIPSGSGETAVCMALAYPELRFVAVYDNSSPATSYDRRAILNPVVGRLCAVELQNQCSQLH